MIIRKYKGNIIDTITEDSKNFSNFEARKKSDTS